jgi:UDP-N-acetyl-D-glucosamine dehydrogenase
MTFSETGTVGVVGLGDTGLPLAVALADAGVLTTGLDTDRSRVAALRAGESYVADVSPDALVATADWFEPTTDPGLLAGLDSYVLCVPRRQVEHATDALGPLLRRGAVVEVRSPVPTRQVAARLAASSGLRPGVDFHVTTPGPTAMAA